MIARISKPARTAMQSGQARTERWLLEFEAEAARSIEPLMGWTSSTDTLGQVRLWFDSEEEAVAYASRHGIPYRIEPPREPNRRMIAYSDNFRFNRVGSWTH